MIISVSRCRARARRWLSGSSTDRVRFAEVTSRLRRAPALGVAVGLCIAAAAPVYGWPLLVLAALGMATLLVVQLRDRRAPVPEVALAWGFALLQLNVVASVLLSGGAASALLTLTLVPLLTLATTFRAAVAASAAALTAVGVVVACAAERLLLTPAPPAPVWLELLAYSVVLVCVVHATHHLASSDRAARGAAALDPLTGLYNRRAVEQHFAELCSQVVPGGGVGVVALDVDHFKHVNDEHGHPRGDAVLREVARRAVAAVPSSGRVYRTGGEEFLVLLPGAGTAVCAAVAEEVRRAVRREPVCGLAVTVSAGVCSTPSAEADLGELTAMADAALYRAKAAGRDRVCCAPTPP